MRTTRNHHGNGAVRLAAGLTALLSATTPAGAEEPAPVASAPRAVSLAEALDYARAHQPAAVEVTARIEAARADAEVPRAQWLPTIGVTAQVYAATENNTGASYLSTSTVDIPRVGGTKFYPSGGSLRPYASTVVGAGLRQEVFDFGRIAAQSAAADALVEVERQRGSARLLDLDWAVHEAYYAVRAAHAVVDASEGALVRARAHRALAKAGVDSGLRAPIELTRAEADLSRFEVAGIRARGGLSASRSLFAAAVGVPDVALDASDQAPLPEDVPSLQRALELASQTSPVVRAAVAELAAQQARSRAIARELRPNLSLTATIRGLGGGAPSSAGVPGDNAGLVPDVANWDVGALFNWPLFDGTVNARAQASRRREAVEQARVEVVRKDQVAAVQQAYVTFDVARRAVPALDRARDAAVANEAQAEARFNGGIGTSVELADAEALRTQAEIDRAVAGFDVARARAALSRIIADAP